MSIIYHPEAEMELNEAASYYEAKLATLGGQFIDEIETAIKFIAADPIRWRKIDREVRRYLLNRFPYAIYYRLIADEIRVLAIKHHSRSPEYWQHRT
jgi:toxin ParE1/3/4